MRTLVPVLLTAILLAACDADSWSIKSNNSGGSSRGGGTVTFNGSHGVPGHGAEIGRPSPDLLVEVLGIDDSGLVTVLVEERASEFAGALEGLEATGEQSGEAAAEFEDGRTGFWRPDLAPAKTRELWPAGTLLRARTIVSESGALRATVIGAPQVVAGQASEWLATWSRGR